MKKTKIKLMRYLIALILILPKCIFCQGWETTFDNGYGFSVQQTSDGGFIIVGGTYSLSTIDDVYLIKTDEYGDTVWTKTYGGNESDFGYSVVQTIDGGYAITGFITTNSSDVCLIKTNEYGDLSWTRSYGGLSFDCGNSVQQTVDGGYIITGSTNSFGNTRAIYLLKLGGNGDTIWTKTISGQYHDFGFSVQQTTDGGFIITGSISISAMASRLILIKIDGNGDILWTKTYGDKFSSGGHSVQQTNDGGYIITGSDQDGYNSFLYLLKTDEYGDTLWTKHYNGNGNSVQQTNDGGYIITGFYGNNPYSKLYLIKTDGYGDSIWTKRYSYEEFSSGNSVQQTTDGGYIITGFTSSAGTGDDIYLIKTDGYGNITTVIEIPTPNPNRKLIKILDLTGREITKPLKNIPYIEVYDDGTSQKKLIK